MLKIQQFFFLILLFFALPFCRNSQSRFSPGIYPQVVEKQDQSIPESFETSLYYQEKQEALVQSQCHGHLVLYMGRWITITRTLFSSVSTPLFYEGAEKLQGSVSSADFVLDNLAIVIDGKLYLYSLTNEKWTAAQGVKSTVTTVSTLQCCFSKAKACMEKSSSVCLYNRGSVLEDQQVYLSKDGGKVFTNLPMAPKSTEFVGGVFIMPAVSSFVTMKIHEHSKFSLDYTFQGDIEETDQEDMPDPLSSTNVIQPAGLRGELIIWSPHLLVYSSFHGRDHCGLHLIGDEEADFPPPESTIVQVATDNSERIAILTSNGVLYYGRTWQSTRLVRVSSLIDNPKKNLMLFTARGRLMLIQVWKDQSNTIRFDTRLIEVLLEHTMPPVFDCTLEEFNLAPHYDKYLYFHMDMGDTVTVPINILPLPSCQFVPMEYDVTQVEYLKEDGTLKASPYENSLATVTVDLKYRGVACRHLRALKSHIIMGCPPKKHLQISTKGNACSKGIITQDQLMNNFSYVIPKAAYDPLLQFRPGSANSNLHVPYSFTEYLCPQLAYTDTPWIPTLEVWNNNEFKELGQTDFVLYEVNGMHNYRYLQSAKDAKCVSQPQNWTTMMRQQLNGLKPNTAWNRGNYMSCKDKNGPPLTDPEAEYQVLNPASNNRILFPNYNGIYTFKAIVVDPRYSYCNLSTTFTVYVHGGVSTKPLSSLVSRIVILFTFAAVLLIDFFLRQHSQEGSYEHNFITQLYANVCQKIKMLK
ncbi:hypothetical protein UPYG_G00181060 [Umbra pygmaea]|uniref:Cation channel sperm-associated auxiliary subunit delta n=1 Tax=Umbra pygmaea TaxID=75934 RepID=A0ABD0WRC7_UMBPY